MKNRICALAVLVMAMGLLSTIGCARQRTHVYSYSDRNKRGWLGVEVQDLTRKLKDKNHLTVDAGAYVSDVVEESPAEDAGIKEGDVIVKLDGKEIEDANDLTREVPKIKPKTEVKVEIMRGGEKKTLSAKIGKSAAPQAFSFDFGDRGAPALPRMPNGPHLFFSNETNGLDVQNLSKQLADYFEVPGREGLLITSVEKGSSAEKAGFKAGDVLTKIDGERIRDIDDLREALRSNEDKDVKCDVIRKGKSSTMTWHLEAEEDDDDVSFNYMTPRVVVPHVVVPRIVVPRLHPLRVGHLNIPNMDILKDQLREMKRELRNNMQELRRNLRDGLSVMD